MKTAIILLYALTFMDLFAVGMIVPLISGRVTALGGSHFVIGLMGSFYSGLQLVSGPFFGSMSDIRGRKPILILTLLACAILYFIFGLTSSIILLLGLRIFIGIFKHTQTLAKAFVADIIHHDEQSNVFGKMAAISGVGISLGPMCGGHLIEDFAPHGFMIGCTIAAFLFIVNAATVYFLIPDVKVDSKKQTKKKNTKEIETHMSVLKSNLSKSFNELKEVDWPNYWDVFLLKALAGFSMSVFYSNHSTLLKHSFELTPKFVGYTISFLGFIGSFCSFFIKYINNAFYKKDDEYVNRNFHCFLTITISFSCLLLSSNWYVFCLMLIPLALGNSVLRLIGLEIIVHRSPPNQRGCLIGASNSVRSIAGILGPTIGGFVADRMGIDYVLIISLVSSLVGLLVTSSIKFNRKSKKVKRS